MSTDIHKKGYCAHCQCNMNHDQGRCIFCGRLIWEVVAHPCSLRMLRTTSKTYADLIKHAELKDA